MIYLNLDLYQSICQSIFLSLQSPLLLEAFSLELDRTASLSPFLDETPHHSLVVNRCWHLLTHCSHDSTSAPSNPLPPTPRRTKTLMLWMLTLSKLKDSLLRKGNSVLRKVSVFIVKRQVIQAVNARPSLTRNLTDRSSEWLNRGNS